jgi:hypothetical protein
MLHFLVFTICVTLVSGKHATVNLFTFETIEFLIIIYND